jgi:hypothetical protein
MADLGSTLRRWLNPDRGVEVLLVLPPVSRSCDWRTAREVDDLLHLGGTAAMTLHRLRVAGMAEADRHRPYRYARTPRGDAVLSAIEKQGEST